MEEDTIRRAEKTQVSSKLLGFPRFLVDEEFWGQPLHYNAELRQRIIGTDMS
jgi:hypothetical protein